MKIMRNLCRQRGREEISHSISVEAKNKAEKYPTNTIQIYTIMHAG